MAFKLWRLSEILLFRNTCRTIIASVNLICTCGNIAIVNAVCSLIFFILFYFRYVKSFFEQIPSVYVPTPYMLKRLNEWGYGKAAELKEWGRGIDLKLFSPERRSAEFRSSKGFHENDIVVLWVGRIVPEKRPDIFMSVVKRLQTEGLPVQAMV